MITKGPDGYEFICNFQIADYMLKIDPLYQRLHITVSATEFLMPWS